MNTNAPEICTMSKTILIAGATGLIGNTTLLLALENPSISRVIALVREPLTLRHPKLEIWANKDLLAALKQDPVDAVICCLGTTIKKVGGNKQKFIHVDKDLVVSIARWAKALQVPVFSVVSAIGANAKSRVFYNRVKGEMEQALKAIGFQTLHIFQPSVLSGPRPESRLGESIGIAGAKLLAPMIPANYKLMPHDVLARAILRSVSEPLGGTHRYMAIVALASRP